MSNCTVVQVVLRRVASDPVGVLAAMDPCEDILIAHSKP